jgi:hypothetical protein
VGKMAPSSAMRSLEVEFWILGLAGGCLASWLLGTFEL